MTQLRTDSQIIAKTAKLKSRLVNECPEHSIFGWNFTGPNFAAVQRRVNVYQNVFGSSSNCFGVAAEIAKT